MWRALEVLNTRAISSHYIEGPRLRFQVTDSTAMGLLEDCDSIVITATRWPLAVQVSVTVLSDGVEKKTIGTRRPLAGPTPDTCSATRPRTPLPPYGARRPRTEDERCFSSVPRPVAFGLQHRIQTLHIRYCFFFQNGNLSSCARSVFTS